MPVKVQCPNPACGMTASVTLDGRRARCRWCGTSFELSSDRHEPEQLGALPRPKCCGPSLGPSVVDDTRAMPPPNAGLPSAIGSYQVWEVLGVGAYGTVYRAYDPQLDREVALKVLRQDTPASDQTLERFQREARAAARLHHPNIVPVYDAGDADGVLFIASALIPGYTLASVLPPGGLGPDRAVRLVIQLAEALAYAHGHGVLHRDVKPANVLLDDQDTVYLTDFGLAGGTDAARTRLTRVGTIMGTPAYMPPEQARGETDQLGPPSDLYSAGVVLYQLLTGKLPFTGSPGEVLFQVVELSPPPPSAHRPGLSPALEAICLKAMAKKPEDRYPDGHALAGALRGWLAVHVPVGPASRAGPGAEASMWSLPLDVEEAAAIGHSAHGDRENSPAGRRPWAALACMAVLAIVALGLVFNEVRRSWEEPPPAPEPQPAPSLVSVLTPAKDSKLRTEGRRDGAASSEGTPPRQRLAPHPHKPAALARDHPSPKSLPPKPVPVKRSYAKSAPKGLVAKAKAAPKMPLVPLAMAKRFVTKQVVVKPEPEKPADLSTDMAAARQRLRTGKGSKFYAEEVPAARRAVWRRAAELGSPDGQWLFGVCLVYGVGMPQDQEAAVRWFRKAAERGHALAQNHLGMCYQSGWGVPKDPKESAAWVRKAAEGGNAVGQINLGWCYEYGRGVPADAEEAFRWYRKATEQGYAVAQTNLALCYLRGKGGPRDPKEAVRWLHKAAEQGYARAQAELGICYDLGLGVVVNVSEAARWYRQAADQDYALGENHYAWCLEHGRGVAGDEQEAIRWYRKAAEHKFSLAQYNLGRCFANGRGVTRDDKEAVLWYRKAAEQNHARAQYLLGLCYAKGLGVTEDPAEAARWYRKAADHGDAGAQNDLGVCYARGRGVEQDLKEAVSWYRKAADRGNLVAQGNLAWCYLRGRGVPKDEATAAGWYRKAAVGGNPAAQYHLGTCYEHGWGVNKDREEALRWYRKSAAGGEARAKEKVKRLANGG